MVMVSASELEVSFFPVPTRTETSLSSPMMLHKSDRTQQSARRSSLFSGKSDINSRVQVSSTSSDDSSVPLGLDVHSRSLEISSLLRELEELLLDESELLLSLRLEDLSVGGVGVGGSVDEDDGGGLLGLEREDDLDSVLGVELVDPRRKNNERTKRVGQSRGLR